MALSLVTDSRLTLADTIGRRLPSLPRAWRGVTLRQLLGHTSGLPDVSARRAFQDLLRAHPRRSFDSRKLLDFVASRPLGRGSRFRYSNNRTAVERCTATPGTRSATPSSPSPRWTAAARRSCR